MKVKLRTCAKYAAALLVALSVVAPMGWLFLMSVSATSDLTRVPLEWLPRQWDFSRYGRLISLEPGQPGALLLHALGNSLPVATGATPVCLPRRLAVRVSGLLYGAAGGVCAAALLSAAAVRSAQQPTRFDHRVLLADSAVSHLDAEKPV